jgi:hypothetical protein
MKSLHHFLMECHFLSHITRTEPSLNRLPDYVVHICEFIGANAGVMELDAVLLHG